MTIKLLFFGITADIVGESKISYTIANNLTIKRLKEQLVKDFDKLKNIDELAIAVNEAYAEDDLVLNEMDIVAIIPPVSGG